MWAKGHLTSDMSHTKISGGVSQLTFFLCFKVPSKSIFSETWRGRVLIHINRDSPVTSATAVQSSVWMRPVLTWIQRCPTNPRTTWVTVSIHFVHSEAQSAVSFGEELHREWHHLCPESAVPLRPSAAPESLFIPPGSTPPLFFIEVRPAFGGTPSPSLAKLLVFLVLSLPEVCS